MMSLNFLSLVLIAQFAFAAEGTSGVGGGGNTVVCFSNAKIAKDVQANNSQVSDDQIPFITKIEILDLWEARKSRGDDGTIVPQIIDLLPDETTNQYVDRIIARVEAVMPEDAKQLKSSANQFLQINTIHEPHGLKKVDDSKESELLKTDRCALVTMAVQEKVGSILTLKIDKRLFFHKKHSALSRAVTKLHEVFYHRDRSYAQITDSALTRLKVGVAITADQPIKQWIRVFGEAGAPIVMNITHELLTDIFKVFGDTYDGFATAYPKYFKSLLSAANEAVRRHFPQVDTYFREEHTGDPGYYPRDGKNMDAYTSSAFEDECSGSMERCAVILDALINGRRSLTYCRFVGSYHRQIQYRCRTYLAPAALTQADLVKLKKLRAQIAEFIDLRAKQMYYSAIIRYRDQWKQKLFGLVGPSLEQKLKVEDLLLDDILPSLYRDAYVSVGVSQIASGVGYYYNAFAWRNRALARLEVGSAAAGDDGGAIVGLNAVREYFSKMKMDLDFVIP